MGDHGLTSTCNPFLSLETLRLSSLDEFTGLVKLELGEVLPPLGTFSHLRFLEVAFCGKKKKLIPRSLLQYLVDMNGITLKYCKEMEEVISEDEEEQDKQCVTSASSSSSILRSNQSRSIKDDEVVLPELEVVNLFGLSKLKSIYKGRLTCGSVKHIKIHYCQKLKRLPFTLPFRNGQPSAPPALTVIDMLKEEWESLEWDHPQYKNVLHPFVRN